MAKETNVIREARGIEFADEKRPVDCKWLQRYSLYEANGNIHLAAKYSGEYLDISAPIPQILNLIALTLGGEGTNYVAVNIEDV
jgi:hypothetical protein